MEIIKGFQPKPPKVVVYGVEGIGKSTFAAGFPKPIFIDTEGSTSMLDVDRMEPTSWQMLLNQVIYISKNFRSLGYKTLVIDTLDWAEQLAMKNLLDSKGYKSIEDPGYGKGYTELGEAWGKFLNLLTTCNNTGLIVVCTAHAYMRKFEQPDEMGAYDRWELKLQKKCAPITKEWADLLLFANYKTTILTDSKTKSKKATGGQRVMYTTHHPAWDAKNRMQLPEELPFAYAEIGSVIEALTQDSTKPEFAPDVTTVTAAPPAMPEPELPDVPGLQPDAPPTPPATDAEQAPVAAETVPVYPACLPKTLTDLLAAGQYTADDLRAAIGPKATGGMGYWPADQDLSAIPPDFWAYLVSTWTDTETVLRKVRLPFNN